MDEGINRIKRYQEKNPFASEHLYDWRPLSWINRSDFISPYFLVAQKKLVATHNTSAMFPLELLL
ncbi:hypothetical protein CCP3SC15_40039 [Gammaproteobacteria bacterium]